MSIILEALRRADAERQRAKGEPPGLAELARSGPVPGSSGLPRAGRWLLLAAAALAVLGAGWWLGARREAPASPPAPLAQAPAPAPAAEPAPAPSPSPTPSPVPAAVVSSPVPAPPAASSRPLARAAAAPATPAPVAPPADAEPASRPLSLAAAQRAGLPSLKVDGVMHSEQASSRVLFLNGQMLREGDTVSPGLVLDTIGPRAALLRWQGQQVALPY